MPNPPPSDLASSATQRVAKIRRWKRFIRFSQVLVAVALFAGVWLVGFSGDDGPAPVLPDTATQFSLDLNVVATTDHGMVYAVEQRARPAYRILSLDPASGDIETIFTVPEDAIIYGIALNPDRDALVVSYSTDFNLDGNGLWELDLDSGDFTEIIGTEANRYLVDPVWNTAGDGIIVTHVDRSQDDEALSIAEVGLDGSVAIVVSNGVDPALGQDTLYYLQVGDDDARRSVGSLDSAGNQSIADLEDRAFDLDHLVAADGITHVAVLESTDDGSLTIGEPADAHGNHNVRSTWWQVTVEGADLTGQATELEPIIVYDAAATTEGAIVYATLEGLSIGDGERLDLIKSRAIRFVAG